jgi:glutathione S-transferase
MDDVPVLWHLKVSHYNEKARWALDHKRIPHVRRAVMPGSHRRVAKRLTGGLTFPVLELDGRAIGDSTRIIEALEQRYPAAPLYPTDPLEWQRALELEEFFDEEFGPYSRRLALHHMLPDAGLLLGAFTPDLRGPRRLVARAIFPAVRRRVARDFGIDAAGVAEAFTKLHATGRRFQAEVLPSGYLVADRLTVADLTLASLLAPLVAPEQFPYPQPQRNHPRLAPVRDALATYGLVDWTREMYARHRGRSAELREGSPAIRRLRREQPPQLSASGPPTRG